MTKTLGARARRRAKFGGITDSPEPENPHEAAMVVTYWAIAILNSKTFWVGIGTTLLGLLSDPELRALAAPLVPLVYLPRVLAVLGIVIVILRKLTKRPVVVLAAPFAVVPVAVKKIGPPAPLLTD